MTEFNNPYLDAVSKQFPWDGFLGGFQRWDLTKAIECDPRQLYAIKYAWAIPNDAAIKLIAEYGPIVEMGAGTGYWASLLYQAKVDVIAFDEYPPDGTAPWITKEEWDAEKLLPWHQGQVPFFPVAQGTPETLREHGDRTLFLCWPPYNDPMGKDCLDNWSGKHLAYVGESASGCTGDEEFHDALASDFELIAREPIPVWMGVHDQLYIYERKA